MGQLESGSTMALESIVVYSIGGLGNTGFLVVFIVVVACAGVSGPGSVSVGNMDRPGRDWRPHFGEDEPMLS